MAKQCPDANTSLLNASLRHYARHQRWGIFLSAHASKLALLLILDGVMRDPATAGRFRKGATEFGREYPICRVGFLESVILGGTAPFVVVFISSPGSEAYYTKAGSKSTTRTDTKNSEAL